MTKEIKILLDPAPQVFVDGIRRGAQTTIDYEKEGGLNVKKITIKLYPEDKS